MLRRYLAYARPYRWMILLVIVAGVAKFTLPLIPARLFGVITDQIILDKSHWPVDQRLAMLWQIAAVMVAITIWETVAIYIRGVYTETASAAMAFDLRQDLWKHLQCLDLSFHRNRPAGSLMSRLMSDISVSQQMVRGGIMNVVIDAVSGSIALAVLLSINWKLTLVVLSILPVYGLLYRKVNPRIRKISQDVQDQTSVMSGHAIERLTGIAVVQSFAQEPAEAQQFAEQGDELRDLNVQRGRLSQTLSSISELLVALGVAMVWVAGAYLAVQDKMSAGNIIFFVGVMGHLYMPIRRFSEINIIFQTSMAAIDRIFGLFDVVPQVRDKPTAGDRVPGLGGVTFDNVEFAYPNRPQVLKGLNFSIIPGERVAIVGESGAGKTTLVTLIPRLYDVTGGAIRIDGLDLRDYRLRNLRRSIGIVLQDTILFSGSVRENLRYGRKTATDEEIIEASKAANAHEFIESLPKGYDTMIGERGMTLSGGQRQRVSLARTILHNPRILILDEATSSLDSESENLITEALQRVMEGRTCLIIAHRLSTIMGADRILVLKEGLVVEEGTHTDLLARKGDYRYLFEQQFGPLQDLLDQSRDDSD